MSRIHSNTPPYNFKDTQFEEHLFCEVDIGHNEKILIGSLYRSSSGTDNNFAQLCKIFNSGRRGYVLTNTTSNFINNIRHVRSLRMSHIYSLFTSNGGCYWDQDLGLPNDISLFHPQISVQKNMFFFLTGGQLIGRFQFKLRLMYVNAKQTLAIQIHSI
jgi:hypothetical protein